MKVAFRNPNAYIVLAVDAALLYLSYRLAYWLRFEEVYGGYYEFFHETVFPIIGIKLIIFSFYGLQSGLWRYTGVVDLINIVKATIVSFVLILAGITYLYYPDLAGRVSRSVFIIDAILTICLISLFRLSIRLYYTDSVGVASLLGALTPSRLAHRGDDDGVPALIYRADERGEILLRSLSSPGEPRYRPIGFLDDNKMVVGVKIHGCPVLGTLNNFEDIVKRFSVREFLVASVTSGEAMETINDLCHRANVVCRVVPAYLDSAHEQVDASRLRSIQIEDLLHREPVAISYKAVEETFSGRCALITGAGGSIGSQLAKQLAQFGPSHLVLLDKNENYLYELGLELERYAESIEIRYHCVDVTNADKMNRLFEAHRPEIVFHAAAHKHVPLMEENKDEAIRNNIGGVKVAATMALRHNVERFILISTDKAVNPSNVMGATKRVCERYVQSLSMRGGTKFMAVRFGNVLGSNGSVVPLFLNQIERRGPVTVTHEDVERYFMTIPEAVLLILQAASMGRRGALYLLDMGEPVKIADLAKKMISMAGFELGKDIDIHYTGLRPGEKLFEELKGPEERLEATDHPKINCVRAVDPAPMDVESFVDEVLSLVSRDPHGAYELLMRWLQGGRIRSVEERAPTSRRNAHQAGEVGST